MASSSEDSVASDLYSDLYYIEDYVFENTDDAISDDGVVLDDNMESDGNESAESDENDEGVELGLAPYMFEPSCTSSSRETSSDENEDEYDAHAEEEISDRVGNILWCLCGNCRAMESHEESVCCKEIKVIPDEYYEGKYSLFYKKIFIRTLRLTLLGVGYFEDTDHGGGALWPPP